MKKIYLIILLVVAGGCLQAQTWNGTTSDDWNTATNWTPSGVPATTSNVTIPAGVPNNPKLASNVTVNNFNMQAGSQLDFNGFTFDITNAVTNYNFIIGATLNNSNGSTDIVLNINTGNGSYYTALRNTTINDNITFNLSGLNTNAFYEADAGANTYMGNTTFNINSALPFYLSNGNASQFNGNLTINRTSAGSSSLFSATANITGGFSYTNNAGGSVGIGNAGLKTSIGGAVNIACNYPSPASFVMYRLINQTTGGSISVTNSVGFDLQKDTLKLISLSITGYGGGGYGYLLNNSITGDVTTADNASYGGGYFTALRGNVITGNSSFTNNGTNSFYDADGAEGNIYNGNVTYTGAGSGALYIAHSTALQCSGNVTVNRTAAGTTYVFNSGSTVGGDFSYTNNTTGDTHFGNMSFKTSIGGTINVAANYATPNNFEILRLINQTTGGIINVQNSQGFNLQKDTLKVASLSMTGYRGNNYGYLLNNSIIGNVSTADDASYTGGYLTALRGNVITGNSNFTNNGTNAFYDADGAEGNIYNGNVTYTGAGSGALYIAHNAALQCSGNITVNRTAAGTTYVFNNGSTVGGNFSYTNNTTGDTHFGNMGFKTSIGGTVNVATNYTTPNIFEMLRLINQTTGGVINVQNSAGMKVQNDTLKVTSLSITGYKAGDYGFFFNNSITGNVTIADDVSNSGGYHSYIRNNVITGNTSITNNGSNTFYESDVAASGNIYNGNTTFNAASSGPLTANQAAPSQYNGNLTVTRTVAGNTNLFFGGSAITGNYTLNNNAGGPIVMGNTGVKTSIGGTINIACNYPSPSTFDMFRLENQTAGGVINVQNSAGMNVENDTLKVASLSITGYKGGAYGFFFNNSITGNVTIADDASNSGGWHSYVRNNVITGNTSITNNGANTFYDADIASTGNIYTGNVTYIKNGGPVTVGGGAIDEITQNLTLNSTSGIALGNIKFNGSTNGVIDQLGTQPIAIAVLIMEKTGTGKITLNDPVTITSSATFTSGNIYCSAANNLVFPDNIGYTGASDASYVDGAVTKIGDDAFTFPVGQGNKIAPISITAPVFTTDAFRAQYLYHIPNNDGYDSTMKDPTLNHISKKEYWLLDRTTGTSNVFVTLSWEANRSGDVNNMPDLRVARWNGSMWKDEGNGGTTGTNATGTVKSLSAVSNFSPFTLSSSTALNPLPVQLISFAASKCNSSVCLLWVTENEQNFSHYEVEKSTDGIIFSSFSNVAARNTGFRGSYVSTDFTPAHGANYYRLKIVNLDGSFKYSHIIKVDLNTPELVSLLPNPATDIVVIRGLAGYQQIRVIDMTGRIRQQKNVQHSIEDLNISHLSAGMYLVQLINDKEITTMKLVKQ